MNNNKKEMLKALFYSNPKTEEKAKNLNININDYVEIEVSKLNTKEKDELYSQIMNILVLENNKIQRG